LPAPNGFFSFAFVFVFQRLLPIYKRDTFFDSSPLPDLVWCWSRCAPTKILARKTNKHNYFRSPQPFWRYLTSQFFKKSRLV